MPTRVGAPADVISRMMNFGLKSKINTGIRVCDATKLTAIQIASKPPISASNRMFDVVQSSVLITIVTAVNVTPFPVVHSAILVAS